MEGRKGKGVWWLWPVACGFQVEEALYEEALYEEALYEEVLFEEVLYEQVDKALK